MKINYLLPTFLAISCLAICGCNRSLPLDRNVRAESAEQFRVWRIRLESDLSSEQLRNFDTAIQEIKLAAIDREIKTSGAREATTRSEVNGKSIRSALILGWRARRTRLEGELQDMQKRLDHDSHLISRPEESDRLRFLSNVTRNETDIIAKDEQLIAEAEDKLKNWEADLSRAGANK